MDIEIICYYFLFILKHFFLSKSKIFNYFFDILIQFFIVIFNFVCFCHYFFFVLFQIHVNRNKK